MDPDLTHPGVEQLWLAAGPGYMRALARDGRLLALELLGPDAGAGPRTREPASDPILGRLGRELGKYLAGLPADFSDLALAEPGGGDFSLRVRAACRAIPWGRTRTYAELAAAAGSPGAARAVGRAMAANRFPVVIPCHRVVSAGGGLGGFGAGLEWKRFLLELEGVRL